MNTTNPFPHSPYRRRTVGAAIGVLAVIVLGSIANVLLVAWLGMVLGGILGLSVGYGTAVAVSCLGHLLVGLLRGRS